MKQIHTRVRFLAAAPVIFASTIVSSTWLSASAAIVGASVTIVASGNQAGSVPPNAKAPPEAGCYELRLLPDTATDPLGAGFTPPRRIRLETVLRTDGDVPEGKPCMTMTGQYVLRPLGDPEAVDARFWIGSWKKKAGGGLLLTWSSGFDGVEVRLQPSQGRWQGKATRFSDFSINDQRDPECRAEAVRIDCNEDR